ncbi:hypothetical protein AYL99_00540 [Fonsecaea erecta]|uniref:Uncharacterized protein n=1 Tax=Fonsecaea erecta TaxID=1367422 RepID=A0A178ZXK7_9EURO|nr:hypothetical protein AYL99_00540 [Fonsecaea erecta]OAP64568.1 hypothetical protein AYL99_00540 [Fonsecaea erecta]
MGESASSTARSKEWTQLRLDTTPLDLRKYLDTHRDLAVQSNPQSSISEMAATLRDCWERDCYEDLFKSAPWLAHFTLATGNLAPAGHALALSPNLCTRFLLRLDVTLANFLITSTFKRCLKWRGVKIPTVTTSTSKDAVLDMLDDIPLHDSSLGTLWWQVLQSYSEFRKSSIYQIFSTKVAEFCLEAGCPAVTRSPPEDIYSLRNHLFSSDSAAREAELRKEIEELRNANRSQQRIITNLAFRHLLEMLPPRDAKPGTSATAAWNAFFSNALKEAQVQLGRGEMGHPLCPVLKKYPKLKQIENVGTNLYGTLSTNIHHFSGQYKVLDDQWNTLEVDILRAITPLAENETEAGIDWQMERFRYNRGTSHK